MKVDGGLNCNGKYPQVGGGGSGGSIILETDQFLGSGSIAAAGVATADGYFGGGSGGRIAIYFTTNEFSGSVNAAGGIASSGGTGGPGTIYYCQYINSTSNYTKLVIDNGGATDLPSNIGTMASTVGSVAWLVNPPEEFVIDELLFPYEGALAMDANYAVSLYKLQHYFSFMMYR